MSASTILTSTRGFVRSSAFLAASLAFAAALPMSAVANTTKTNPVTGETETYVNTFTGETAEWDTIDHWDTSMRPYISGGGSYAPALVDGRKALASTAIDGYQLRVGAYNGASVTWSGGITKIQGSTTGCWLTVDETSSITIASFAGNQLEGNDSTPFKLSSAKESGINWVTGITSAGNTSLPFWYYLKGSGTVAYNGDLTVANAQVIKMADITLSGTSQVASKTLVTFGSGTTTAFTADAAIKVKNGNGDILRTVPLASVTAAEGTTLTTDNHVGSCELVQTSTGIVLYYVDGDPESLPVYKPSININFTHGGVGLTTVADVGIGEYAVPGTSWSNMAGSNGSSSSIYGVDSTGEKSLVAGASVTISGALGSYRYTGVDGNVDLRYGYIDDAAGAAYEAPQVVVDGIPYYKYQLVLYFSNDTNGRPFGHLTINGTNYKWDSSEGAIVTCEGTVSDVWGSSSGTALTEGGNYLVFPAMENPDGKLTIVGHRWSGTQRMGVAAIQIVEVKPDAGADDLVIEVSGDTEYTVAETKDDAGTVYITGNGTLTLAGESKISAETINVGPSVTLNVNSDRLDADTFTGGGTVVYDGVTPGLKGWADSTWTGTVWIKNVGSSGSLAALGHTADSTSTNPVNSWGNAYSFVKFTNVYGYMSGASCPWTLILEDDGDHKAWYDNDGWSGRAITIGGLKGSGTFYDVGNKKCRQNITFTDASAFTGSIHVEGKRIGLGGTATVTGDSESLAGVIEVVSGKTAALASGQTWYAGYRIAVNGTLTGSGTLDSGNTSVAISGSGTVVFDGKAPSPTGDLWWKNAAWTGTVEIKNITDMIGRTSGYTGTYLDFNSYGNADSLIKLGTLTGWMDNYTCNVPVNLAGTLTINNGVSGETFTFKKLISDGGCITATDQSAKFSIRIEDGSEYAGYIGLNSKRVIFGTGTAPDFVKGQIYVSSDATITVPSVDTAYWAVGSILVDGELNAASLDCFGDGTTNYVGATGTFTLMRAGGTADFVTDYSRVQGSGSIEFAGTSWYTLPTNGTLSASLGLKVSQSDGVVVPSYLIGVDGSTNGVWNVGRLSGGKNIRCDWDWIKSENYARALRVLQSADTVWSGELLNSSGRMKNLEVLPGLSSAGTLTLSGTQTTSNNLVVATNASVNITGTWVGPVVVDGTIAGTGTIDGALTVSDGATIKVNGAEPLKVTGNVTLSGNIAIVVADDVDLSQLAILRVSGDSATLNVGDASFTAIKESGKVIRARVVAKSKELRFSKGGIYIHLQ